MLSQGTCHCWQDSTLLYDLSTLGLFDAFLCACVCFIHNQWKSVRWNLKSEKSEKQDCKIWGAAHPHSRPQILYNCPKPHAPRGCTIAGSLSHHFLPPEHREQQQPSTNSTEIVHELNVIFSTTAATTTRSTTSNTTQQQQQQQLQKQQRKTKHKLHMLMTGSNRITLKDKITNTNKKHWYLDILPSSNRSHIKFQLIIFPPHHFSTSSSHLIWHASSFEWPANDSSCHSPSCCKSWSQGRIFGEVHPWMAAAQATASNFTERSPRFFCWSGGLFLCWFQYKG